MRLETILLILSLSMVKSFKLNNHKTLSKACIQKGLTNFESVFKYISQIPYGRTSDRSDYTLVLDEHKGTCSTKHAFLKAIAIENNYTNLNLYLGIFGMNGMNTPKIKPILDAHQLDYIPEAHCYLKCNGTIIDITFGETNDTRFAESLMHEETILPQQIGTYKVEFHKSYLKSWIIDKELKISFDNLWTIRELCIAKISE